MVATLSLLEGITLGVLCGRAVDAEELAAVLGLAVLEAEHLLEGLEGRELVVARDGQ